MTAPDGLLRDAGGARPASDVDALIERLEKDAIAWGLVFDSTVSASTTAALEREAVNALVQLRDENARLDRERESNWILANGSRERAERAEAERDALTKDAARYRWLQLEDRRRKEKP